MNNAYIKEGYSPDLCCIYCLGFNIALFLISFQTLLYSTRNINVNKRNSLLTN